jgi:hypothetical protein
MNSAAAPRKVAVVAHDAGGAEILASYVAQEGIDALFVLAGPAEQIFRRRFGEIQSIPLSDAMTACGWVLTGTGWQTDLEWNAIQQGRAAGKHVVTFLDHWVNYPARFVRNGITSYPDEIWAGDEYAVELAIKSLPGLVIRQVVNPHFNYFVSEVQRMDGFAGTERNREKNILFVCENINHNGFHQNDAIRYFMNNLDSLGVVVGQILIRSHPSESADKYAWVPMEFGGNVALSHGAPLAEEVAASDIVAGCSSMAMALAVMARRRVISCIPNNAIPMTIPFRQVELLSDIVKRRNDSD